MGKDWGVYGFAGMKMATLMPGTMNLRVTEPLDPECHCTSSECARSPDLPLCELIQYSKTLYSLPNLLSCAFVLSGEEGIVLL